jgi:hypothetical protein
VEELYFFRRYEEAVAFIRRVMVEGGGGEADEDGEGGLDRDSRELMMYYEEKCLGRMGVKA